MVPAFGYIAVCAANPAAWVAADLFLFPAYGWAHAAGLQPRMNGMQKKTRTCRVMRMRTRWRPLGLQKRESIGKQPF